MSLFWTKYIIFELKKYWGVLLDGTEYWCNIWRKTDLCFQKWHEEFDEFWPKHSKISKICSLMGFFWLKYMIFELKKVSGSFAWWNWILMQHLKENLLVVSKLTWGIWRILTWALENIKNLHFHELLLNKVHNLWAKKNIGEFCLMALNIDATSQGKLTCAFKNDMRNLTNFDTSTWKSQKFAF